MEFSKLGDIGGGGNSAWRLELPPPAALGLAITISPCPQLVQTLTTCVYHDAPALAAAGGPFEIA